ncbi:capsule-associated protein CAP1 [Lambiella insularis]|nr:capsule-associated protein CAP1 [Lambiella insularis]
MDLAFNVHDEPRIVVPHEDLEVILKRARENSQAVRPVRNTFSSSHLDLEPSDPYPSVAHTRFVDLTHQFTWSHTQLSWPPSSPARQLFPPFGDDLAPHSSHELGFVTNITAFSDICLSPSLNSTFDRLSSFQVSLDLIPVFSPSKLSSFQDILYPLTWYYMEKVPYDEESRVLWREKDPRLYWRGSTSSGWAQNGNWPHQLRQSIVMYFNSSGPFQRLRKQNTSPIGWVTDQFLTSDFAPHVDVQLTEIKSCADSNCEAQLRTFDVTSMEPQAEAWKARYLLDMDGNTFSGRFYAFMRSRSLPLKLAYFREWHWGRLQPWVHFVPVSWQVREVPELVRYFEEEEEGTEIAERVAETGREWVGRVLRTEDMEVWMFRLLLEFGRLVDDGRQEIGYS